MEQNLNKIKSSTKYVTTFKSGRMEGREEESINDKRKYLNFYITYKLYIHVLAMWGLACRLESWKATGTKLVYTNSWILSQEISLSTQRGKKHLRNFGPMCSYVDGEEKSWEETLWGTSITYYLITVFLDLLKYGVGRRDQKPPSNQSSFYQVRGRQLRCEVRQESWENLHVTTVLHLAMLCSND